MNELPPSISTSRIPGPPADGTELTLREVADRLGVSLSTIRRRIKNKSLVAYKRPSPDGLEYRIPVTALGAVRVEDAPRTPVRWRISSADTLLEVAQLRHDLALSRQEADLIRDERDCLRTEKDELMKQVSEALSKLPTPLPPAPDEEDTPGMSFGPYLPAPQYRNPKEFLRRPRENDAALRHGLALSRQEADLIRAERDHLRAALVAALEKLSPAKLPAPAARPRRWFGHKRAT